MHDPTMNVRLHAALVITWGCCVACGSQGEPMASEGGVLTTSSSSEVTASLDTTATTPPTSSTSSTGTTPGMGESTNTGEAPTSSGESGTGTGVDTSTSADADTGTSTGDMPSDCDPLPAHTIAARDHLDAWGVVFSPGGAQSLAMNAAALDRIGVRRIRSHLAVSGVELWQAQQDQMIADGHARPALKFDDLVIAYNQHPATWDEQKPAILAAAAAGLLTSIEGPNEMNNYSTGGGTHGVNDKVDRTEAWAGPDGNVYAWAAAIHTWKTGLVGPDAEAMASVELLAPSIASGLAADFAALPNLAGLVDFGNVHFYAGGGHSPGLEQLDDNPDVGYFANLYHWAQAAMTPGVPVVVSECGATTPPGAGYGPQGQAKYVLNQLHEGAGIGARYLYIYTLFDPSTGTGGSEGNFGLFQTDGSEKPVVPALAAVKQLLSLGNDYDSPANDADTKCFEPGYDGAALTVSGIGPNNFSSHVADAVIYPKSDGSTLISVTNEPRASDDDGQDLTPTVVVATLHLGSVQSWHLYDVLGPTPLLAVESGTGDSIEVPLSGYPRYVLLDTPPGYQP